jgi:hypothetical protein
MRDRISEYDEKHNPLKQEKIHKSILEKLPQATTNKNIPVIFSQTI